MTNLAIDNALATSNGVLLSSGEELWLADEDLVPKRLVFRFPDARHGIRAMFADSRGFLFAAPNGRGLSPQQCGLWASFDLGATWRRVIDLGHLPAPAAFWGITEDRNGILFAGVYALDSREACAFIYRSLDRGSTWSLSYGDPTGRHVHDVVADQWTGVTYATIGDSMLPWRTKRVVRTADGGATWEEILPQLPQVAPIAIAPGARLFGSDEPGRARIFRSEDDKTFTTVLDDPIDSFFFWARRDPLSGTLLAGTVRAGEHGLAGIYSSVDDGRSWSLSRSLPAPARWDGTPAATIAGGKCLIVTRTNSRPSPPIMVRLARENWREVLREFVATAAERSAAATLLLASSPILLGAILATRMTRSGPALFVQPRHGFAGSTFRLYKLRTMEAVRIPNRRVPMTRVTPLGRLLRMTSMDELPQLWNVLRGDMSLVGPRPHPISLDREYSASVPDLMERYAVKPGVTGLAQTSGSRGIIKTEEEMRRRIALDLEYVRVKSLNLDLKIVIRTAVGGFLDLQRRGG